MSLAAKKKTSGGLLADAKKAASTSTPEPPRAFEAALGERMLGEAHKLWDVFTAKEAEEKAKSKANASSKKLTKVGSTSKNLSMAGGKSMISKASLKEMVVHLQRAQRMHFVSLDKLEAFVDREFSKYDKDGNLKMDFNEFYALSRVAQL